MSKTMPKQQPSEDKPMKQMKVFLNLQEHAVVTAAANMKGMHVRDYMKMAVIEQAKKDAKAMTRIIEDL